MDRRRVMFGAAALAVAPSLAFGLADQRRFRLIRKGSDIGSHTVTAQRQGAALAVTIEIAIAVKVLGFTVYRYTHRNDELWVDGALQQLSTTTDDDGAAFSVSVQRAGAGFEINGTDYSGPAPAEIAPTSYWNYKNLEKPQWVDTQGGKLLSITAASSTAGDGREKRAIRGDFDVDLYYDSGREWRGLDFRVDGEVIRYEETAPGPRFADLI